MSMRKATVLAGLVLAVAALSPVSALAKAGGTDRPVKGIASGTVSINVPGLAVTGDFTGIVAHLGKVTSHLDAGIALTPQGTAVVTGAQTVVGANGDQLTGDVTITGPAPTPGVHSNIGVITVTGGTGRFEDASGELRVNSEATPFSFDGVTLLESLESKLRGRLSY